MGMTIDNTVKLYSIISRVNENYGLEVYRIVDSLLKRLQKPVDDIAVAVFWLSSRKELDDVIGVGDFLSGIPTILVLPDQDRMTIAEGQKVNPVYLTFVDKSPYDVGSVIDNIMMLKDYRANVASI
jgi:hypothetical protein